MKPEQRPAKEQEKREIAEIVHIELPHETPEVTRVFVDFSGNRAITASGKVYLPTPDCAFKEIHAKIYHSDPGLPDEKPPEGDKTVQKGKITPDNGWQFTKNAHPIPGANCGTHSCSNANFLVVWALFQRGGTKIWKSSVRQFCGFCAESRMHPTASPPARISNRVALRLPEYSPPIIDEPLASPLTTDVLDVGGQYVIEACGVASRTNSSIQGVFARIYRRDITQWSSTPPPDATVGRLFGATGWDFRNGTEGDLRIPGAVAATGDGADDNLLLVWIFYGGDASDAANYDLAHRYFNGLLVDPPPGGGSVGDT